jgi:O-antigen/teichoic acid export membrane protein
LTAATSTRRTGLGNVLNLAFLVGSFGAGQGAIFLVQTLLVAEGDLALLARFGTCFSFAILAVLLIDFGSQTTLARNTAVAVRAAGDPSDQIWSSYWHATVIRAGIALLVVAGALAYISATSSAFERWYVLCALPAALAWPFNATGLLDGLRMSGAAGLVGAAPYVCSAAALFLAMQHDDAMAGALAGSALAAGYVLSALAQLTILALVGRPMRHARVSGDRLRTAALDGGSVFLAMLPGQLYYRLQLILAATFLGPSGTALFLYAKQIATGFAQLVAFVRRVEFPELVALHASGRTAPPLVQILRSQRTGTVVGLIGSAAMLTLGAAAYAMTNGEHASAALAVVMFSPTVVAGAIMAVFTQALQARGHYRQAALIMSTATLSAAATSGLVAPFPSLAVFVAADLVVCLVACLLALAALRRIPSTAT